MKKKIFNTVLALLLLSTNGLQAQIVISEIMRNPGDPASPKSNGQWFEIYNISDQSIDLRNWTIEGASSSHKIFDSESNPRNEPFYIQSGEFFLFVTSADQSKNGGLIADYQNPIDLKEGTIKIYEPGNSMPVDEVVGFNNWYKDDTFGDDLTYRKSMVLKDLSDNNSLLKNWVLSTIREDNYNQDGEDTGSPGTLGSSAFKQLPKIEWDSLYGGDGGETLNAMLVTKDSGCIMGGYSESGKSGNKTEASKGKSDFWVIKTDKNGLIEWDKTIGGDDDDELNSIVQTFDGGYLLGGDARSGISGDKTEAKRSEREDFWIVKLDGDGNIEWDKTIGGDGIDYLKSVETTADGGYILGGHSFSNISGEKTENSKGRGDYWVVKLDSDKNIEWDKTLGGEENDILSSVIQTNDGGYIASGETYSGISGDKTEPVKGHTDFWIVKLNANGTFAWDKTYGGDWNEQMETILETKDGGFILGGWVIDDDWNYGSYLVIKTDNDGNVEWEKKYSTNEINYLGSIQETTDGGYIIGGEKEKAYGAISYLWIIKTDGLGNILWEKTISRTSSEHLASVQTTEDGGYFIGAESQIIVSQNEEDNYYDFWLVKLSTDPTNTPTNPNVSANPLQTRSFHLNIYPNPVSDVLYIELPIEPTWFNLKIMDVHGRIIQTKKSFTCKSINVSGLPAGVYLLNLQNSKGNHAMKFIKK